MSSLRLVKVAMCGLDIIKNFSEMHKLHRLVRVVYALAFARIFHVIVKSFFFSFNCHRYLLSSVSVQFLCTPHRLFSARTYLNGLFKIFNGRL